MKKAAILMVLAITLLAACSAPMEAPAEEQTPTESILPSSPQYEPPPTAPDVVEEPIMEESVIQ